MLKLMHFFFIILCRCSILSIFWNTAAQVKELCALAKIKAKVNERIVYHIIIKGDNILPKKKKKIHLNPANDNVDSKRK